jgi:hypothetical protein
MLIDANSSTAQAGVTGAIRKAAQLTGANFQYLLATAKVESNLDAGASARSSSAGGLFQFIDQTWLGTLKQAGASLGYGQYADAITQDSSGRYVVTDPTRRAAIMNLRQDPTANAVMAGAFTNANAAYLTERLGRQPSDGELYLAHFLGPRGAANLISLAAATPNASAADAFPRAANANPSIFYGAGGAPRSLGEVARLLSGRYDVARMRTAPLANDAQTAQAAPIGDSMRVARAYQTQSLLPSALVPGALANVGGGGTANDESDGYLFRNPYRRTGRQQIAAGTAGVVNAGPSATAVQNGASAASTNVALQYVRAVTETASANEPLGLFQDMRPNVRALFGG